MIDEYLGKQINVIFSRNLKLTFFEKIQVLITYEFSVYQSDLFNVFKKGVAFHAALLQMMQR